MRIMASTVYYLQVSRKALKSLNRCHHVRGYPTTVDHKLTVEAKDGRYRYVLTDFYSGRPLEDIRAKRYEEFLHRTNEECILLIASLERAMTDSEDDEW